MHVINDDKVNIANSFLGICFSYTGNILNAATKLSVFSRTGVDVKTSIFHNYKEVDKMNVNGCTISGGS